MDKQILKTIQLFFGELEGETTDLFYEEYKRQCKHDEVEPREKNVVIREACDEMGLKTKPVVCKIFERKGAEE